MSYLGFKVFARDLTSVMHWVLILAFFMVLLPVAVTQWAGRWVYRKGGSTEASKRAAILALAWGWGFLLTVMWVEPNTALVGGVGLFLVVAWRQLLRLGVDIRPLWARRGRTASAFPPPAPQSQTWVGMSGASPTPIGAASPHGGPHLQVLSAHPAVVQPWQPAPAPQVVGQHGGQWQPAQRQARPTQQAWPAQQGWPPPAPQRPVSGTPAGPGTGTGRISYVHPRRR